MGQLPTSRIGDGRIAAIEPVDRRRGQARPSISGDLVSPPFVDPHFHMDATLSYGLPRINASGTLLEGIGLWGELKPLLTHEAVIERALPIATGRLSMGLLAIRYPCRHLRRPDAGVSRPSRSQKSR
jgi:cytosine deaminase